eukprot:COSAG06_NODE_13_length_35352_cov_49.626255_20_plen_87_part_00
MVYQDRLRTGSGQQQHTAPALEWALQVPEWSRLCAWLGPRRGKTWRVRARHISVLLPCPPHSLPPLKRPPLLRPSCCLLSPGPLSH